jgi:hypothetical protein
MMVHQASDGFIDMTEPFLEVFRLFYIVLIGSWRFVRRNIDQILVDESANRTKFRCGLHNGCPFAHRLAIIATERNTLSVAGVVAKLAVMFVHSRWQIVFAENFAVAAHIWRFNFLEFRRRASVLICHSVIAPIPSSVDIALSPKTMRRSK